MNDLALNYSYNNMINKFDGILREIIDYPAVATNVEEYNKDSFVLWRNSFSNQTAFNNTIETTV